MGERELWISESIVLIANTIYILFYTTWGIKKWVLSRREIVIIIMVMVQRKYQNIQFLLEWHSALIFGEIVQTWYILALIIFQTLQSVTTVSVKYKKKCQISDIFTIFFTKKFWEHCGWFYFFFFTWKLPKHEPQGTPGKVT